MLLTLGCVGLGTVIGLATARALRCPVPRTAAITAILSTGIFVIAGILATLWQNIIRSDVGAPPVGWTWTAMSIVPAAALYLAVTRLPRVTAVGAAMVFALFAGYLPAASADSPPNTTRIPRGVLYEPLGADGLSVRAQQLSDRWVASGGLGRHAVVIAVPTGSGWVDTSAITGFTDRFRGDASILTLQYAQEPSWRAFIGDRGAAGRSAVALLDAVISRIGNTPGAPKIYLYGQSLGAIGADTARSWADTNHPGALTQTLLSGVPGECIEASPRSGSARAVRANASDPVPRWSPALLWRPVHEPTGTSMTGRATHRAPWLPVVTFISTSVDLLSSLDGGTGVGHRYGTEQAWG